MFATRSTRPITLPIRFESAWTRPTVPTSRKPSPSHPPMTSSVAETTDSKVCADQVTVQILAQKLVLNYFFFRVRYVTFFWTDFVDNNSFLARKLTFLTHFRQYE